MNCSYEVIVLFAKLFNAYVILCYHFVLKLIGHTKLVLINHFKWTNTIIVIIIQTIFNKTILIDVTTFPFPRVRDHSTFIRRLAIFIIVGNPVFFDETIFRIL